MDEQPKLLFKIGDVVSFLRFTRDKTGQIIDVQRLEGTIMELAPTKTEPYIVGMYNDKGEYWETYADTTYTKLISHKQKPLKNGPKRNSPYITFEEEDFLP